MEQEKLKYHQQVLDLIGQTPTFSPTNLQLLEELEHETQLILPASIKEWYSLENGVEILANYSNTDNAIEVKDLGRPDKYHHYNFLLEQNLLIVLLETQSVWSWAVRFDGSDDPPVFTAAGYPEPDSQWLPCAESFSTFIYTRVWDFKDWGGNYYLWAIENKLQQKDLEFLQSHFTEGPQTYSYECINRRFYNSSKCLLLLIEKNQTEWNIWASNYEELLELVTLIWNCANLANTLEAIDDNNYASSVLKALRNIA